MRLGFCVLALGLVTAPVTAQSGYEVELKTLLAAQKAEQAAGQPSTKVESAGTKADPVPAKAVEVSAATAGAGNLLPAGTAIKLKMHDSLTTKGKQLRVGQGFQMEVAEPVVVDGAILVPVGSRAFGEVTAVKNRASWGRSGRITAKVLHVQSGDQQIKLTGQTGDKGVTGTVAVIASAVFFWPAGFLVSGTSASIPAGTVVNAVTEEDTRLTAMAAPAATAAAN